MASGRKLNELITAGHGMHRLRWQFRVLLQAHFAAMVEHGPVLMLLMVACASTTPGQLITYCLVLLVLEVILITGGIGQVHEGTARVVGRDDLMLGASATDSQRMVGW